MLNRHKHDPDAVEELDSVHGRDTHVEEDAEKYGKWHQSQHRRQ